MTTPPRAISGAFPPAGRQTPRRAAAAILAALDAERRPLRLPLGSDAVDALLAHLDAVRCDVTAWEETARATAHPR